MNRNVFDRYDNDNLNVSNLRSLCLEAGFNETELTSNNPNNNREGSYAISLSDTGVTKNKVTELEEEIQSLSDTGVTKNKVTELEKEIQYLRICNAHYINDLKCQKDSQDLLTERIKELERFVDTKRNKDVQVEEASTAINSTNVEISEKEKKQNDLESQVISLVSDVQSVSKKMEIYSSHLTDISQVVFRMESEVQKFIRRHSLVIENLCPKEDSSAMEMLLVFAKSVLNVKLEDYDIESLQIIERASVQLTLPPGTPEKRTTLPRPVLVTFTCYKIQAQIYKAWLSFRCKNTPGSLSKERGQGITIKEYLTEAQENIYSAALKHKEKHLIVDCWTYKGKTYIKKLDSSISEFSNNNEIVPKNESSSCTVM